jgi:hypothetical protein
MHAKTHGSMKPGTKVVAFDAIPLEREADFRRDPEGPIVRN